MPHIDALHEIGRALSATRKPERLASCLLDAVTSVLGIESAALALFDDDAVLEIRESRGDALRVPADLAQAAIESRTPLLAPLPGARRGTRTVLCAPLQDEQERYGVLLADSAGRPEPFTREELEFCSALAHLASFALADLSQAERLRQENERLRSRIRFSDGMVLASPTMAEVHARIVRVAAFDATVLITGESGVGKEMVAREIHRCSPRRAGPLVTINCAAIPEALLESELFGYAPKSAIAGADPEGRAGRFEQADGGTIFLDEIAELKPSLQAKLLRVLQDHRVDRLNDTVTRDVDVRILVATNRALADMVLEGGFREDLYYRLKVVSIEVPPLRERREEVAQLAEFFVRTYPGPESLRSAKLSRAAVRALEAHSWPGNVRELKNSIEQALILGDGRTVRLKDLPPEMRRRRGRTSDHGTNLPSLAEIESEHIARVLGATGWNKARSARILGISKPTLYDKIRRYSLVQD